MQWGFEVCVSVTYIFLSEVMRSNFYVYECLLCIADDTAQSEAVDRNGHIVLFPALSLALIICFVTFGSVCCCGGGMRLFVAR